MLRIIAGEYRSRVLLSPPDSDVTRPYLGRIRESVFGMLHGWFEEGPSVLDLFAGVGTVGLEAVSRGARSVLMVEQSRKIYRLLEENVKALGCEDRAVPLCADALGSACLHRAEAPVDLVFIDPPFETMREPASRQRVVNQMGRCAEIMRPGGFLILRAPMDRSRQAPQVSGLAGPEEHVYRSDQWVLVYQKEETGRHAPGPARQDAKGPLKQETEARREGIAEGTRQPIE